jgi:hypothetical protein
MKFHIAHFSAFSRRTFHLRPQDGVFRCDFNKKQIKHGVYFLPNWAYYWALRKESINKKARLRQIECQASQEILSTVDPPVGGWLDFKNGNNFFLKSISHVWVSKVTTCRLSHLGHAYIKNEKYCQELFFTFTLDS